MPPSPSISGPGKLPGRLVADIEETFGRRIHRHEARQFAHLIHRLGRPQVEARLSVYRQAVVIGHTSPITIARWLKQAGLWEVCCAA